MRLKTGITALFTALVLATASLAEPPACSTENLLSTAQSAAPTFENAVTGSSTCDYDYSSGKTIWHCVLYRNDTKPQLPVVTGETYYEARFAPDSVQNAWKYRLVFRFSGAFGSGAVTGKYYTAQHYNSFCKL